MSHQLRVTKVTDHFGYALGNSGKVYNDEKTSYTVYCTSNGNTYYEYADANTKRQAIELCKKFETEYGEE